LTLKYLIIFDFGMHFPLFIILFIFELHFWAHVLIFHVLVAVLRWFMLTIVSLSISLSANGSDLCTQISVYSACMLTMGQACTTNWVVIQSIFLISVTLGIKFIFPQYHRHFPSLNINRSVLKNRVRMSDLYF
jgi:hypothetical protein